MTSENERRRFHFQLCLGRGGFGEVYLAEMHSAGGLRSRVAVKILLEDIDARSQAVQRLRDEGLDPARVISEGYREDAADPDHTRVGLELSLSAGSAVVTSSE